jgi:dihydropteroate synthase
MRLRCAGRELSLDSPVVMGVLNLTPDSFSDGGRFNDPDAAVARAETLVLEGAAILDIGGESTRPGAAPVDREAELRRVLPVLERIAARVPVLLSVDTSNPEIMRRAAAAGAHMINDVRALRAPGALEAAAGGTLAVCLVHMRGEPADMQREPQYAQLIEEVSSFLAARRSACEAAGIARERLCIDPGFGFGKTVAHNRQLLARLGDFRALGLPIAVGLSRKSLVGALTGRPLTERLAGSIALATIAVLRGARIVRAHDVAATVDALKVAEAFREDSA